MNSLTSFLRMRLEESASSIFAEAAIKMANATLRTWTPAKIHQLADQRGVKWDNDTTFMNNCERWTGKRHLDAMSPAQLAVVATALEKTAEVEYRGKTFPGYNKPVASDKKEKKMMVLAKKGDEIKLVHFGQKGYQHNYNPEAKQNYLTRSAGIRNKSGQLTKDDPFSPNYWARKVLWPKGETGHGHNGPVNTEVRMQRKEAGLKEKLVDLLAPARSSDPRIRAEGEFRAKNDMAHEGQFLGQFRGNYKERMQDHVDKATTQEKSAGIFAEDKFVDSPFGKIHDMDHSYAVDHLPMHTDDPHITRDAIIKGIAATPKPTFTPGGFFEDRRKRNYERDMASWNRTRDPDYLHRLAMDVAHNGDPSVFGVHPEKKASLRSFLEKEANAVNSLAQRLHGHEAALAGGLIGAAGGAAGGHVSTNDPKNKKRNMVLGGLAGGVAGSIGAAKARKHLRAEGLLNALHGRLTDVRKQGADLISVHGPEDLRSKYTSKELADIAATARKRYGFKTASVPATALGDTLLEALIERKEDEKLAAALKLAEDAAPANKKWSWKGFREGIRDEGIPMAGMVGGAYLGNRLLPGGSGAVYGSGIGYGSGALANLGLEHVSHKKQQAKTASDSNPSSFIPGAIGATLGAGIAGGLTKEDKNKGRNMLAGSAIGYGLADAGMLARELIKKRMAK